MFGRPYNLFMQHALYRALPHREGGGVPRDIATDTYDRAAVRAQLRKELKCIRNVDMFALLAAHVIRLHSRKAPGTAAIPACTIARASGRPPVTPTAARTVASLLYPHRAKLTPRPAAPRPIEADTIDYGSYPVGPTSTERHPERSEAPAVHSAPLDFPPLEDTASIQLALIDDTCIPRFASKRRAVNARGHRTYPYICKSFIYMSKPVEAIGQIRAN